MKNLSSFKWITQDPLSKNENQRYYYDFGTGEKIEREEVKKQRDAFLEGFNSVETMKKNKKETDVLYNKEPKITKLPGSPLQEVKIEKLPYDPQKSLSVLQYANVKKKDPWGPSLGGDLKSNKDKELFLDGFVTETKQAQNKTQNKDAIEFGEDSETYKILQDLSKRWYATSDSAEKDRLHEVAERVRMYHRQGTPIVDRHEAIMNLLHENKKRAQDYQKTMTEGFPGFLYRMSDGNYMLDSSTYLIGMVDEGEWDYKYNDDWRVKYDYFDGKYMDTPNSNYRNWTPWMYFDGRLISADKLGNMNMAYVGKSMGLPEWVYKNFETMDKDDPYWVQYGIDLAKSGR